MSNFFDSLSRSVYVKMQNLRHCMSFGWKRRRIDSGSDQMDGNFEITWGGGRRSQKIYRLEFFFLSAINIDTHTGHCVFFFIQLPFFVVVVVVVLYLIPLEIKEDPLSHKKKRVHPQTSCRPIE